MIGVLGLRGRLGSTLIKMGAVPIDCDITNQEKLRDAISKFSGDTVINCAAYTDVDGAEGKDYSKAVKVNSIAPVRVKFLCDRYNLNMIHISTDYVFNGKNGPYTENNLPRDPVNAYGLTKFAGEYSLKVFYNNRSIIVRTTGLYGSSKHDFLHLVHNTIGKGRPLSATDELIGNQTHYKHLATALIELAKIDRFDVPIVHIASKEYVSRNVFAHMIAEKFGYDENLILPVKNKDIVSWKASRPSFGGLTTDLAVDMGLPIYSIETGLELEYVNK